MAAVEDIKAGRPVWPTRPKEHTGARKSPLPSARHGETPAEAPRADDPDKTDDDHVDEYA
ncbi:MAG: hypothetical protein AB1469_04580 [Pseudomonadota bacterium]